MLTPNSFQMGYQKYIGIFINHSKENKNMYLKHIINLIKFNKFYRILYKLFEIFTAQYSIILL